MKNKLRLLLTTLCTVVIACGLSISASANETIPAEGLEVPTTEYEAEIQEGTTMYEAGSGTITVTVNKAAQTIVFALSNATIEGTEYGISFGDRWADYRTTITLEGENTVTVTGENKYGIKGMMRSALNFDGDGDLTINANNGTSSCGIHLVAYGELSFDNAGKLTINTTGTGIFIDTSASTIPFATSALNITAGAKGIALTGTSTTVSVTLPTGTIRATDVGINASNCNMTVSSQCNISATNGYDISLSATEPSTLTLNNDCDTVLFEGSAVAVSGNSSATATLLTLKNGDNYATTIQKSVTLNEQLSNILSDGIALSGPISNSAVPKTNASLTIKDGATMTIPSDTTIYLDSVWTSTENKTIFGTVTVNGGIQNNGTLYIGDDTNVTTAESATTIVGGQITIDGTDYIQSDNITETGFNFKTNGLPEGNTYYSAGKGYMLYNKIANTITLHNATIGSRNNYFIDTVETVILEGVNQLTNQLSTDGNLTVHGASPADKLNGGLSAEGTLTIQNCTVNSSGGNNLSGDGGITITRSDITVTSAGYGISSSNGSITITDSTVEVTAKTYGIQASSGSVTINGSGSTTVTMVSGDAEYDKGITAGDEINISGSVNLTVTAKTGDLAALSSGAICITTTGAVSIECDGIGIKSTSSVTLGNADATESAGTVSITTDITSIGIQATGVVNVYHLENLTISGQNSATAAIKCNSTAIVNTNAILNSGYNQDISSISITQGATVSMSKLILTLNGNQLTVDKDSRLTVTGAIESIGPITIGAEGSISATSIDKNGFRTLSMDGPIADMIRVPTNGKYTGSAFSVEDGIYLVGVTKTICGADFKVTNDDWTTSNNKITIPGWDYTITDETGTVVASDAVTDAGTYTVTYRDTTTADNSDSVSATFTVAPTDLINTTSGFPQKAILVGDSVGLPTAPSATVTGNNAITVLYSNNQGLTYTLTEMTFSSTGTHTVYYQISASNHYPITGILTVEVEELAFTGDMTALSSAIYGETWADILDFASSNYFANEGGTLVPGTFTLTIDDGTYTPSAIPNVKVGNGTYSWEITYTSDNGTYTNISVDSGTVTITPATLTAEMVSYQETPTYTSQPIEAVTEVISGTTELVNGTDYTVDYDENTNVGTATATVKGTGNYTGTIELTFDIQKCALSITGVNVDAKAYDGTITTQNPEFLWSGVQGDDTIAYFGTVNWTSDVAGTDKITYSIGLTGTSDDNYSLTLSTAQGVPLANGATITQRPITITADNQTITYGGEISKLTADVVGDDLVSGHKISTVTLTQNSVNVVPQSGEALTITPSAVTILDGESVDMTANYDITYADGTLDITPKALTITTLPQEVTYGTAVATTTDKVIVTGLISGEALDSIVLTESNKNMGVVRKFVNASTPVIKNGDTVIANDNYTITYADTGALTIHPLEAVLAWTGEADSSSDFSFTYDGTAKTVTATVSNTAYEDELSFDYSESSVGSHTATITDLGNGNYVLPTDSSVTRNWEITKAPVTITVTNNTALTDSGDTAIVTTVPSVAVVIAYYDNAGNLVDDITSAPAGTYSMVATMNDADSAKYYFSGSVGGTANLGSFIIAATEPTLYTVSFDETTSSALAPAIAGTIHILPTSTASHPGDVFVGWSCNNVVYPAGSRFTQPSQNVDMVAVWETPNTITGTVTDSSGTTVAGATVTISQNGITVATATTNRDGSYMLPATSGNYQVTVEANGITSSSSIAVDGASVPAPVALKSYSTTVNIEAGLPIASVDFSDVADALKDAATAQGNTLNQVNIAPSSTVASADVALITEKSKNIGFYVDITLSQTVDDTTHTVTNTSPDLVKATLNIPADFQEKSSFVIYRVHDGVVDTITTSPNANGEKLVVSADKTSLELHVCKFSTYALGYIEGSSGGGISYHTSSVAPTENGDVTLSGERNMLNSTVTITPTPDEGYEVGKITVVYGNGREVKITDNGDGTYSYKQPGTTTQVTVTFVKIGEIALPFVDVAQGAYYYDAIQWAVENGITNGTTATTFSPNATCTRAQAVTFLWNAAGKPRVSTANPFADVTEGAWYYDAVLWAVSEDITNGTTATTFSPNAECTRSQIVTFLWNAAEKPVVNFLMTFEDVAADNWYGEAVRWAVSEGITTGTSETAFSPTANCTRGQIVTFLYRSMAT